MFLIFICNNVLNILVHTYIKDKFFKKNEKNNKKRKISASDTQVTYLDIRKTAHVKKLQT